MSIDGHKESSHAAILQGQRINLFFFFPRAAAWCSSARSCVAPKAGEADTHPEGLENGS